MYAETERAGLCEFLDMQREALIEKLQGVSDEDARRAPTVSSLSLLSLVKHSAIWERRWFQVVVAGRSFAGEWPEGQPQDENAFRLTKLTVARDPRRSSCDLSNDRSMNRRVRVTAG